VGHRPNRLKHADLPLLVLSGFKPISHGVGSGVALPYTMASNLSVIPQKLALIASSMGERTESLNNDAAGKAAVRLVYNLMEEMGLSVSLRELGYERRDLEKMAETCIVKHKREYNPKDLTVQDCAAIFEAMWNGSPEELYADTL
jgi:alcohol dehydrogenase class IV